MLDLRTIMALPICAALATTTACASSSSSAAPSAALSPAIAGATVPAAGNYRIGPLDRLNVTVFQVKDLTLQNIQVDGSGRLSLPLIGSVSAAGRTPDELAAEIASRLSEQYLQSPQVSVTVQEAVSQKVTIDGAVREPGVYSMSGPTTLLQAVAMAKGPDVKFANLSKVAIFRTIDGQRNVAVYNIKDIRAGKAIDPEVRGNDVIVVDGSAVKGLLREALAALPALAVFRPYY